MTLRELRKNAGITQKAAANFVGMPLRTYVEYENDPKKQGSMKYKYLMDALRSFGRVDEENGILTLEQIREACIGVFETYPVEFCYLFGSYAKGKATEKSDVDLLVHTSLFGIDFFGLVESLREKLKKRVDVLDQKQLENNLALTSEILKDGIKIYG